MTSSKNKHVTLLRARWVRWDHRWSVSRDRGGYVLPKLRCEEKTAREVMFEHPENNRILRWEYAKSRNVTPTFGYACWSHACSHPWKLLRFGAAEPTPRLDRESRRHPARSRDVSVHVSGAKM